MQERSCSFPFIKTKKVAAVFIATMVFFIHLSFCFVAYANDLVYSLFHQSTQGYLIASKAQPLGNGAFALQISLLDTSSSSNTPISFSIYDSRGYIASAQAQSSADYTSPTTFGATITPEQGIEAVYLIPVLRQGGEDAQNQTATYSFGELARVTLASNSSKLNLRSAADTDSSVIATFDNGTPVLIVARSDNSWVEVTISQNGELFQGYMSNEFLLPVEFTYTNSAVYSPIDSQNAPSPTPAYQRSFQANQQMSAGYTVSATAQEQADRPNWFTFNLSLAYNASPASVGNITLFYLYLNDEFFGVLTPYQGNENTATQGKTYALSALIGDQINSLSLIPVYDGWAKGSEVIPLYAVATTSLMTSQSSGGQDQLSGYINTQPQPIDSTPAPNYKNYRTFSGLQTMQEGYTLYATAIEDEQGTGQFAVHAFFSFDPQSTIPQFSMVYLYVNSNFWATLSPYDDQWNQQWQQTSPTTFEVKVQINQTIDSILLVPVYSDGQVSGEAMPLHLDP